jgi:3-octaprenyl-4-hydroxybenzoate carboxy-lyase
MHTTIDPPARKVAANQMPEAPKQDLRAWLAAMEAADELTIIRGAEREQEIGGIVDIYQRTPGSPAVLFDDIPGYPAGYRVLANILTSVRRINLTLGLASDATEMDLVRYWRDYHETGEHDPSPRYSPARCWTMSAAAATLISSKYRRPNGTSMMAATISARAAW